LNFVVIAWIHNGTHSLHKFLVLSSLFAFKHLHQTHQVKVTVFVPPIIVIIGILDVDFDCRFWKYPFPFSLVAVTFPLEDCCEEDIVPTLLLLGWGMLEVDTVGLPPAPLLLINFVVVVGGGRTSSESAAEEKVVVFPCFFVPDAEALLVPLWATGRSGVGGGIC
jgi:hypothetical protein